MSLAKLQQKIGAYEDEGWVRVSKNPFERLCKLVAPSNKALAAEHQSPVSQAERTVSAKLFAIISRQGKTSAATALFNSRSQVDALVSVSWGDIDWYVSHPSRTSISGMYSLQGFPDRGRVEELERWVKQEAPLGHGKKLFSSITGMQCGRGVPEKEELDALKSWCITHAGEQRWLLLLSHLSARQEGCNLSDEARQSALAAFHAGSPAEPLLSGSRA